MEQETEYFLMHLLTQINTIIGKRCTCNILEILGFNEEQKANHLNVVLMLISRQPVSDTNDL